MSIFEKKHSIITFIKATITMISSMFLLLTIYFIREHMVLLENNINLLHEKLKKTSLVLDNLKNDNLQLKQILKKKSLELLEIKTKIYGNSQDVATHINTDLVVAQNQMAQFYIKTAGVIFVGAVVAVIIYKICTFGFTLKALLPSSVFNLLRNTWPFQERYTCAFSHVNSGSHWLVNFVNDEITEILVRQASAVDFINAVTLLTPPPEVTTLVVAQHQAVNALVPVIASNAQQVTALTNALVDFI